MHCLNAEFVKYMKWETDGLECIIMDGLSNLRRGKGNEITRGKWPGQYNPVG